MVRISWPQYKINAAFCFDYVNVLTFLIRELVDHYSSDFLTDFLKFKIFKVLLIVSGITEPII